MLDILRFLLRPLIHFLDDENGEEIYQYLYYTRSGIEKRIESAIEGKHNITIVGNPGHGKTSLMHYMFIEFKKKETCYPIILDYRNTVPKKPEALLTDFVIQMRKYFDVIKNPINIQGNTNLANAEDHSFTVSKHLAQIPNKEISKKLLIFIDDLDYAEDDYLKILNNYFMPYASSDKSIVVLSVRKPLLNSLKHHDQLRQYYHIHPREIQIPDDDLEIIINNRLKTILRIRETEGQIVRFLRGFKKPDTDTIILDLIRKTNPELASDNFDLPFLQDTFYAKLRDMTYFNLRQIEELLPTFIQYEIENPEKNFSTNFDNAFIRNTIHKPHILIDLVSEKTSGSGKNKDNSILQVVLEYFYFEEAKDDTFYKQMKEYGISKEQAEYAIGKLTKTPYFLIEPEFVFSNTKVLVEKYEINIKGIKYVENILQNDLYYNLENHSKNKYVKSKRSYFLEKQIIKC